MKTKTTPDERFLLKLYQAAQSKGDPYSEIDYRDIDRSTAAKNIVKHLAQANFVKKVDETTIHLTPRGCQFILSLQ